MTYTNDRITSIVPPSCAMTTRDLVSETDGIHIAKVGHMDYTSGDVHSDVANALRLAACWNACHGIPTEALKPYTSERSLADHIGELERALRRLLDAPKLGTNDGMRRAREHAERVLKDSLGIAASALDVSVTVTAYNEATDMVSFEFYDASKGRVQQEVPASVMPFILRKVGRSPLQLVGQTFTAVLSV